MMIRTSKSNGSNTSKIKIDESKTGQCYNNNSKSGNIKNGKSKIVKRKLE